MRKLLIVIALGLLSLMTACESSRTLEDGHSYECVGVDDSARNPKIIYKASTTNIAIGVIFIETIYVPLVVAFDELYCPVKLKTV